MLINGQLIQLTRRNDQCYVIHALWEYVLCKLLSLTFVYDATLEHIYVSERLWLSVIQEIVVRNAIERGKNTQYEQLIRTVSYFPALFVKAGC